MCLPLLALEIKHCGWVPQKLPVYRFFPTRSSLSFLSRFLYLYHIWYVIPNYMQYCFPCFKIYVRAVIFFVFCCSLIYSALYLLDSSMVVFVCLVHSFELVVCSVSLHEDAIMNLSPALEMGIHSLCLTVAAATDISTYILLHRFLWHWFWVFF